MRSAPGFLARLLVLALAMSLGGISATSVQANEEILPGIYRLDGIEETLAVSDLNPLKKIVRGVKVLGLGEDVHTTRGFSRAKFRLFKYLVTRHGYRVFGFESPWIRAESVATYVETCEGTPEAAIGGLFGVWQNESVRDLVLWMCRYNQRNPGDPLHFYGFDHQQGWDDAPRLKLLLQQFGVGAANRKVRWLDECAGATARSASLYFSRSRAISDAENRRCLQALTRGWKFLDRRGGRLVRARKATAADIEWARIHIVGLRSWHLEEFFRETEPARAFGERDRGMAYIAAAIREIRFPGAKTALWAHNSHISSGGTYFGTASGILPMGSVLKGELGAEYEALGLVAYESHIDWPGVGCGSTGVASPSSLEGKLHELEEPFLLIDLDFPGTSEPFFPHGTPQEVNGRVMVPRDEFRALIFLETAEKMVPLSWSPCPG